MKSIENFQTKHQKEIHVQRSEVVFFWLKGGKWQTYFVFSFMKFGNEMKLCVAREKKG